LYENVLELIFMSFFQPLAVLEYLMIVIREDTKADLSDQEILDCNIADGGCDGGKKFVF